MSTQKARSSYFVPVLLRTLARASLLAGLLILPACASETDPLAEARALDGHCLDAAYNETPCANGSHKYIVESYREPGDAETCANASEHFRAWPAGGGHCLSRVTRLAAPRETVDEWATRNEDALTELAVAVQRLQRELQDPKFYNDQLPAQQVDRLAMELRDAVDALASAGAVPDAQIQAAWSAALQAQRDAANAVRVAAASGDRAAVDAAVEALDDAGAKYAAVSRLLRS